MPAKKTTTAKPKTTKKVASKKTAPKKASTTPKKAKATKAKVKTPKAKAAKEAPKAAPAKPLSKTALAFLEKQKQRLLILKDTLLDSMREVARDSLRNSANGGEGSSAFGQHQADAGSETYDRDFALSMLSHEQDSLYEIDEALRRIDQHTYGICEMSNKAIPKARLEALPFTRYTVECQAEIEKQNRYQARPSASALFGNDSDDDSGDDS
ncbi:MAG: TraR/DksA family transcriptional regulator [Chthoniobacterales bacterium]